MVLKIPFAAFVNFLVPSRTENYLEIKHEFRYAISMPVEIAGLNRK